MGEKIWQQQLKGWRKLHHQNPGRTMKIWAKSTGEEEAGEWTHRRASYSTMLQSWEEETVRSQTAREKWWSHVVGEKQRKVQVAHLSRCVSWPVFGSSVLLSICTVFSQETHFPLYSLSELQQERAHLIQSVKYYGTSFYLLFYSKP
jgi:hypothetical protein